MAVSGNSSKTAVRKVVNNSRFSFSNSRVVAPSATSCRAGNARAKAVLPSTTFPAWIALIGSAAKESVTKASARSMRNSTSDAATAPSLIP